MSWLFCWWKLKVNVWLIGINWFWLFFGLKDELLLNSEVCVLCGVSKMLYSSRIRVMKCWVMIGNFYFCFVLVVLVILVFGRGDVVWYSWEVFVDDGYCFWIEVGFYIFVGVYFFRSKLRLYWVIRWCK